MNALRETEKTVALALHKAWRIIIFVIGGSIVLIGAALVILPGPGWLTILLGLTILASEFVWAGRLLKKAQREIKVIKQSVQRIAMI
jgi:uncharacterized protein (TIGR02611 family)